jgi:hypothetical protein
VPYQHGKTNWSAFSSAKILRLMLHTAQTTADDNAAKNSNAVHGILQKLQQIFILPNGNSILKS